MDIFLETISSTAGLRPRRVREHSDQIALASAHIFIFVVKLLYPK